MALGSTNIDFLVAAAEARGLVARLWQIITGCLGENCAVGLAKCWGEGLHTGRMRRRNFLPRFWFNKIYELSQVKKDCVVGVGWHGELFTEEKLLINPESGDPYHGTWEPAEGCLLFAFAAIIRFLKAYPESAVYLLTKQPIRFWHFLNWHRWILEELKNLSNFYAGTTVNRPQELGRIYWIRHVPAKIFVMFEPLMGDWCHSMVTLASFLQLDSCLSYPLSPRGKTLSPVAQAVIGGWSRRGQGKADSDAVHLITNTAHIHDIKVFHKKNLGELATCKTCKEISV